MVSIKTVAEQAQVSIATVSRVLNGTKYVSPDVQKRVMDAVETLRYEPNAPARNLRRQRTQSIGILLPQLNDFFFSTLAYVLEKGLSAEGYSPLFGSTENDHDKEMSAINNLIRYRVDAVVLAPAVPVQNSIAGIERLRDRGIATVVIDRDVPNYDVNQVLSNNEQGGYDGASYLIKLGHQHIGIIDSAMEEVQYDSGPGQERTNGMVRAMHDAGLWFDPTLVVIDRVVNIEMGYRGALRLLRQRPQVTAIFAMTDAIAVGVLRAAFELGLNVPRDLSVMGFDDILLASHVIPRLTSVAQPVDQIAQTVIDLVLRQIEEPDAPTETFILPTELVIRESTAPRRSDERQGS